MVFFSRHRAGRFSSVFEESNKKRYVKRQKSKGAALLESLAGFVVLHHIIDEKEQVLVGVRVQLLNILYPFQYIFIEVGQFSFSNQVIYTYIKHLGQLYLQSIEGVLVLRS